MAAPRDGAAPRGKPNPRRSNGARRSKLRRQVAAEGLPCHLCGKPIDYSLPPGDPMCYELDEITPVSKGGDPFSRGNVAPAHRICNQRRGNRDVGFSGPCGPCGSGTPTAPGFSGLPVSQDW